MEKISITACIVHKGSFVCIFVRVGGGEGGSIGTRGMFVRDQSTRNRYQISSTENSTLRGLFFRRLICFLCSCRTCDELICLRTSYEKKINLFSGDGRQVRCVLVEGVILIENFN